MNASRTPRDASIEPNLLNRPPDIFFLLTSLRLTHATLAREQMLLKRHSGVSVSFTLSRHPVHPPLVQLRNPLGLGTGLEILHTILTSILSRHPADGTGPVLGCPSPAAVNVHGVLSTSTAAGHRTTTSDRLGAGPVRKIGRVNTKAVHSVLEFRERLLHGLAGDNGLVIQALLLEAVLIADELLLLTNELSLAHDVGLLIILDV